MIEKAGNYFTLDELSLLLAGTFCLLMIILSGSFLRRHTVRSVWAGGFLCVFLLVGIFWISVFFRQEIMRSAIVTVDHVESKFAPSLNSTDYFNLYEGEKVNIVGNSGSWIRVKTLDGNIGWVRRESVQQI